MLYSKELKSFITIVQEGSYVAAARTLFVSQPALSRQIKILEEYLGFSLFKRTNSGVQLTEGGKRFYEHALELEKLSDAILLESRRASEECGILNLGIPMIHSFAFLTEACLAFEKEYPDARIEFHISDTQRYFEDLREKRFDVAIGYNAGLQREKYPDLGASLLYSDPLLCGVHGGHPLADQELCTPKTLADYPVFMVPEGRMSEDYDRLRRDLEGAGARIVTCSFERGIFMRAAVENGVIVGSRQYLKDKGLHFLAFEELYDMPAYAFHAKQVPPVVERFIQTARKIQSQEE